MEQQCESKVWAYELLDWINEDDLCWSGLSSNPNAIDLLEMNPEKIDWGKLSSNPNAINLLENNPEKINWYDLSASETYEPFAALPSCCYITFICNNCFLVFLN